MRILFPNCLCHLRPKDLIQKTAQNTHKLYSEWIRNVLIPRTHKLPSEKKELNAIQCTQHKHTPIQIVNGMKNDSLKEINNNPKLFHFNSKVKARITKTEQWIEVSNIKSLKCRDRLKIISLELAKMTWKNQLTNTHTHRSVLKQNLFGKRYIFVKCVAMRHVNIYRPRKIVNSLGCKTENLLRTRERHLFFLFTQTHTQRETYTFKHSHWH